MEALDLIGIHADMGFTYDSRGRMLCTNEPHEADRRPAPRLFLGRTSAGQIVRLGATVPHRLAQRLTAIVDRQLPFSGFHTPPAEAAEVREVLESHTPITSERGGPVYRFPTSITAQDRAVQLSYANCELVRETYPWLYEQFPEWGPCFVVVRNSDAVSVCFSARRGIRAAAAGVETLPDFRGRGYAAAVTAAWGAAICEAGGIPLYSTTWDNGASQGVARRLELIMFGADTTWT